MIISYLYLYYIVERYIIIHLEIINNNIFEKKTQQDMAKLFLVKLQPYYNTIFTF